MNREHICGAPLRILLVEDNAAHAELIRRVFSDNGVANTVEHLSDGETALDYLFRRGEYGGPEKCPRPDVILLDLRLPRVAGLEVLRQVKASEELRPIPVVILTTSDAEPDIAEAYRRHAASYLVKPVDFEKFHRMMRDVGFHWLAWNDSPWRDTLAESLREEERQSHLVNDTVPYLLWVYDLQQWRNIYANRAFAEFFGLSREESLRMPGAHVYEQVHPEDRQVYDAHVIRVRQAKQGDSLERELRIRHCDGQWRWMLARDVVFRTAADGSPREVIGTAIDVTARKLAEAAREAQGRQQASVAKLGVYALACTDLSDLFHHATEQVAETLDAPLCKILELSPDGRTLLLRAGVGWQEGHVGHATVSVDRESQAGYTLDMKHPVIVEEFSKETRFGPPPLLQSHHVVSGMSVVIDNCGVLGVHSTERRTFTEDDTHYLQAVANLLSEAICRRRAEEAMRASEQKFRDLIEGSLQGILIHRDYKPLFVNESLAAMCGFAVDELLAMDSILFLVAPPYQDQVQGYYKTRLRGESAPQHYECQGLHKDGSTVWIDALARVVEWDGQPAVQITAFDITRRKEAEAAMRRNERLASIGTLAAGIAHEINNPLGAIMLYAETAMGDQSEQHSTTSRDEALQKIIQQTERCARIVKSVLQFSRQTVSEKSPLDLRQAAEVSKDLVTRIARDQGVRVDYDVPDQVSQVVMDPTEIEQVLFNLINNAIQASPRGSCVRVGLAQEAGVIRIVVTDEGQGITSDELPRVFDPFYTTRQMSGGTGLGMSIVHGIVTKHGGTIDIDSRPGQGTKVSIAIPCD